MHLQRPRRSTGKQNLILSRASLIYKVEIDVKLNHLIRNSPSKTPAISMKTSLLILAITLALAQSRFVKNVQVCPGYEDGIFQFVDGNSPEEVPLPGAIVFDMHINIKEDLPSDLMLKLELQKLEPFPLDVPCLNGLGSW